MNVEIKFDNNWTINKRGAFRGTIFDEKENKIKAAEYFKNRKYDDIHKFIDSLHGFWGAVVQEKDSFVWLISDVMRSFPVFYAQNEGILYISNDTNWLKEKCHLSSLDIEAKDEFLSTGYVTGADTLYKGLNQLQAGEVVIFQYCETKKEWHYSGYFYYRYLLQSEYECSHDELLDKFWSGLCNVFKRLINYADGRPIVVPLSGGYDSRLIAIMLKHFKYDNIITFSYGVSGNANSSISQIVASDLNIPWHFVEYTNTDWRQWYLSEEMRSYEKYAGGFASLPHFQDWPAVMLLREKKLIPDEAVFVPGHCIEMGVRTEEYPEVYANSSTIDKALNASVFLHYCLNDSYTNCKIMDKYKKRILSRMGDVSQFISPASLFDCFEQQERQVKYINNSVRVYEFWGYDWWTPLWERDYQNFWSHVPLKEKEKRKLYVDNMKRLCSMYNVLKSRGAIRDDDKRGLKNSMKKLCKKLMPYDLYAVIREIRKKNSSIDYQASPLAYYGCFSEEQLQDHLKNGRNNICGMLANEYFSKIM